jgi:hypothetical protein
MREYSNRYFYSRQTWGQLLKSQSLVYGKVFSFGWRCSRGRTASVITSLWDCIVCFTPSQPLWGVTYSHVATELHTAAEQITNTRNLSCSLACLCKLLSSRMAPCSLVHAVFSGMDSALPVRKSMARNSGAVFATAFREGGTVRHCN